MIEIERRFFVQDSMIRDDKSLILQSYLSEAPSFLPKTEAPWRIRAVTELGLVKTRYYAMTKQRLSDCSAQESPEFDLTQEQYRICLNLVKGRTIVKLRAKISGVDGLHYDLDYFIEPFLPYPILEVEFRNIDSAKEFSPQNFPAGLNLIEEVTYRPNFSNRAMSNLDWVYQGPVQK